MGDAGRLLIGAYAGVLDHFAHARHVLFHRRRELARRARDDLVPGGDEFLFDVGLGEDRMAFGVAVYR